MSKPILNYFNEELNYLKKQGQSFSERYPKLAGRLKMSSDAIDDPFVSRLMESFAFLTSKLRHKLDDEYAFVTNALLNIMYPHFQLPIPSMSIASFQPKHQLQESHSLPRHTRLVSRLADGRACYFRTAYDVMLKPIEIKSIEFTRHIPASICDNRKMVKSCLNITLSLTQPDLSFSDFDLDELTFFINLPRAQAAELYEMIFNHHVSSVVQKEDGHVLIDKLGRDQVLPVGFSDDESLLPLPASSFSGYRLLTEYFSFQQKFMFFKIDFSHVKITKDNLKELSLTMFFDRATPELETYISADSLQLFCTPVVNLFEKHAEPIKVDFQQSEYHVVADIHQDAENIEIYQVLDVKASLANSSREINCVPFYGMSYQSSLCETQVHWYAYRKPCWEMGMHHLSGDEVCVAINPSDELLANDHKLVLKPALLCTNRELPADLPYVGGHIQFHFWGGNEELVEKIETVTSMTRPIYRHREQSKMDLVNHIMTNQMSFSEHDLSLDALKSALANYHYLQPDEQKTVEHGLVSVNTQPVIERHSSQMRIGFCQGVEYRLTVNEEYFPDNNVFLFAGVINEFLSRSCAVNSFMQLTLISQQRGEIKQWIPKLGCQRQL